jgi:hypothetical protein
MSKVGITKEELLAITRSRLEDEQQRRAKCMPEWLHLVKARVIDSASHHKCPFANILKSDFARIGSPATFESEDVNEILKAINGSGEGLRARSDTAHFNCESKCSDPSCCDPTIYVWWG